MTQQTCRTCGAPLTPRGHCPHCYRRRCARCGRPLLKAQSVAFTATENYHLILPVCTDEAEKENSVTPPDAAQRRSRRPAQGA